MSPPQAVAAGEQVSAIGRRVHLAAGGVSLVIEVPDDSLPRVVYWGHGLGAMSGEQIDELVRASVAPNAANGIDAPSPVAVLPEPWTGWTGTPGLSGHRAGQSWSPRFTPIDAFIRQADELGGDLSVRAIDVVGELEVAIRVEMFASGLVRMSGSVTNLGEATYAVEGLHLALPVPTYADEIFDLAGRWAKERFPQRGPFRVGAHVREGRHGRTGADAATVLTAAERGFGFDAGEVWGLHVAFSGNHRSIAERVFTGERLLLGGELLLPGEVTLEKGETYASPDIYATYGEGLDASAARFHEHLRSRETHPHSPRPVTMNVWEAVYFEHNIDKILSLADLAAEAGVERFVLDDGWFGSRRDDTAGLGDWRVSDEVWGDGRFGALVDHVTAKGMEFGLWFEPEMVNLDSDLARAHPDWILQVPGRWPAGFRHQQVVDLANDEAFAYLRDSIVSLVSEYEIAFIKWDHNRDLTDAGSVRTGRASVHEQTLATYRLMDSIREACPGLEIESCSSGGGRVDLGILQHTDRVWASDCIDAHERQQIQRWTAQLLPPELVGSHIGAETAHTTGRSLTLPFRAATALFGHFGIEWDLTSASDADREQLAEWVTFYKQWRALIHSARVVRATSDDESVWLHGAVGADGADALYSVSVLERPVTWPAGRIRLPGLDGDSLYRVTPAGPAATAEPFDPRRHPGWWSGEGIVLPGRVLSGVGIQVPALQPDTSTLIAAHRIDEREPSTGSEGPRS
ncbi:MAG: alpha-galactosidase [Microbacterium sp.]|uniref:alpha-galactosidase n=1 Tax=Microbacterium sp. TaxID=51671 RepID=UPI003BB17DAB